MSTKSASTVIAALCLSVAAPFTAAAQTWTVQSPNSQVTYELRLDGGTLSFYQGSTGASGSSASTGGGSARIPATKAALPRTWPSASLAALDQAYAQAECLGGGRGSPPV